MNFSLNFKILFLWILAGIFNIITFFLIFTKVSSDQNQFALKYNVISGVEWYGTGSNLYFFPLAGLVIGIINYVLYKMLDKYKIVFLKELTVFTTIAFQLALLIAVIFLMKVN